MNSNSDKYVQINKHTSSDQIFVLLNNVQSDKEEVSKSWWMILIQNSLQMMRT